MLYRFFELLLNITVRLYFRRIYVNNQDLIPKDKPVLFVANHQSAFMDPIVIGVHCKRTLYFLARGESFRSKIASFFFKHLHMIPIYRKEEDPELVHKNEEIFNACYDHFEKDRCILIFPEGNSVTEPRLRKLKTGAARIALGAESNNDFNLGLTIIPVGINYSDPHNFRSDLFMNFGTPIEVKKYEEEYKQDSFKAARNLTDEIQEKIEERILIIEKEEDEAFLFQLNEIFRGELIKEAGLTKQNQQEGLDILKEMVEAYRFFSLKNPKVLNSIKTKMNDYFNHLRNFKNAENLFHARLKRRRRLPVIFFVSVLILGAPLFLYGWIINYAGWKLTGVLARKLTKRDDFLGSVKMLVGMFFFLIFYIVCGVQASKVLEPLQLSIFIFSMPISGLFALWYVKIYKLNKTEMYFRRLMISKDQTLKELIRLRKDLVFELHNFKDLYLKEKAQ